MSDIQNDRNAEKAAAAYKRLYETIRTLRAPGGCPWDREQTPLTMRRDLIEETFEAVDAVSSGDAAHAKEELGDVILNASMIAYMYEQQNDFSVAEALNELTDKLIRRHPHVFPQSEGMSEVTEKVTTGEQVLNQWDRIKENVEGRKSRKTILDEVPEGFPPLLRAYKMQKKAAKKGYSGMCITTLDLPEVQREVFALTDSGIPVVSVNTDIPDSGRICYVGTDYKKAGYTAAGMLSLITKEKQKLLIVSGSFHMRGHNDRIKGFCTGLAEHGIAYKIIKTVEAFDSNEDSYILTHTILSKHPEITGVFVVAGGVPGVYRAIKELGRSSIVPLVFDDLPEIKKIIQEGGIGFTICQEPETQGYIGIMRLFGYLMEEGKKLPDDYITQTIIKSAGNI